MNQPSLPHIEIEPEFAACVRKLGGEVLADRLPASPGFENADYLFPEDGVVAELKRLDRDTRNELTFKQRVTQLQHQWIREGKVPAFTSSGTQHVSTRDLPRECQAQVWDIVTQRIRRVIEKANNQIKRTKKALALPNAKGLLLLVNDGDGIFELGVVEHILHRVLHGKYRQINGVVFFTVNKAVTCPGVPFPAFIWRSYSINDDPQQDRPHVGDAFLEKIRDGWFRHEIALRRVPLIAVHRGDDPQEVIDRVRFVT